jgi:hypothetical protein
VESRFLNVDLDLRCQKGVGRLLKALGKRVRVHHAEETWAAVELAWPQPSSAEDAIERYAKLVRKLSAAGRAAWKRCESRTMNIGIEAGTEHRAGTYRLGRESLALIAELEADVLFTVYSAS